MVGKPTGPGLHRANARHVPDVTVELRLSHYLLIAGSVVHVLAVSAVLIAAIPSWLKTIFSLGLGYSLMWFVGHVLHRWHDAITHIICVAGHWRLETRSGAILTAELIGGYGHPSLIILNFRLDTNRRRSLTLLPDSADPDSLRRLRVLLRIRRESETVDGRLHR